jgi:hypothetical protein
MRVNAVRTKQRKVRLPLAGAPLPQIARRKIAIARGAFVPTDAQYFVSERKRGAAGSRTCVKNRETEP